MDILETLIQLRNDIKTWVTNNLVALDAKIESKTIPIDSELNTDSTNPVQNKVIAEEINKISEATSNITDDGSGEFNIADPNGNVIMKVDVDGVCTTNVDAQSISTNNEEFNIADPNGNVIFKADKDGIHTTNINTTGEDFNIADTSGNVIFKVDADGVHTTDITIDGVSVKEKMAEWDNSSDFSSDYNDLTNKPELAEVATSGDYNDLTNAPAIVDDGSGEVVYADNDGNAIAKIDADGITTTKVIANEVEVGGKSVNSHVSDTTAHITADERTAWNNKSDFSGSYNDLTDKPDISSSLPANGGDADTVDGKHATDFATATHSHDFDDLENKPNISTDETDDSFSIADSEGNIIGKIDVDGFKTTKVTANEIVIDGKDVFDEINKKADGTHTHDYAANGHTHTNVQPVAMSGDILTWALTAPLGLTPIYTGSSTTSLPSSAFTYSNGYVLKRTSNETTVVLYAYTDTRMAANHYVNSAWKGWTIAATEQYVDDAVSNITVSGGSYTPTFCKYKGSASSATTTTGTSTTVTMATRSFASNTAKFSVDSGGIQCVDAGTVRVSGEVRIQIPVSSSAGTIEVEIYCGSDRMFRSGIYLPANAGTTGTPLTIGVSGGLCKISAGETLYLKIISSFATTYYPSESVLSIEYV